MFFLVFLRTIGLVLYVSDLQIHKEKEQRPSKSGALVSPPPVFAKAELGRSRGLEKHNRAARHVEVKKAL